MIKLIFVPLLCLMFINLSGCGLDDGFGDLDVFINKINTKPRGGIEPLPEVRVYRAFTYTAANRRGPFLPPVDTVISDIVIEENKSNIQPDFDRPKEVLESYAMTKLRMVGTLRKQEQGVLWALISDSAGGVHMTRNGQYMGKNYGRIVNVKDGQIEVIEIVPNGHGGWLERPRTITLDDE